MEKERANIEQLRKQISDIIPENPQFEDSYCLYLWLQAGKLDADKTEGLIRETVKWRKEKDAKSAIELDFHPGIQKCLPVKIGGRTKLGFTVVTTPAGEFRFGETIQKYGREAVEYYWFQILCKFEKIIAEQTVEVQKENGESVVSTWAPSQRSWLILDMKNFQLSDLLSREVLGVILALFKILVAHFPTMEGTMVFINVSKNSNATYKFVFPDLTLLASKMLELFFKIIRPALNGTKVNMLVFGTDDKKWKPFILEQIDPAQIDTRYGGTLEGPL